VALDRYVAAALLTGLQLLDRLGRQQLGGSRGYNWGEFGEMCIKRDCLFTLSLKYAPSTHSATNKVPPPSPPPQNTTPKQPPTGAVGQPADVAELVLFLADGNKSRFITGQSFVIDGGVSKRMVYPD